MTQNAELRCRCGTVTGVLAGTAPDTVNRMVCYCDDCQAFVHRLGRADLLDDHGGSEVVQIAPAALRFERGHDHIAGLRLSPKGLFRYYTRCCNTPLGNTFTPAIPFIGIVRQAFAISEPDLEARLGPIRGAVRGEFAVGDPPAGSTGFNGRLIARALGKMLGWRLRGRHWPHPFFDQATRQPRYPIQTLSRAERDALRPLCGPRPNSSAAAPIT